MVINLRGELARWIFIVDFVIVLFVIVLFVIVLIVNGLFSNSNVLRLSVTIINHEYFPPPPPHRRPTCPLSPLPSLTLT